MGVIGPKLWGLSSSPIIFQGLLLLNFSGVLSEGLNLKSFLVGEIPTSYEKD